MHAPGATRHSVAIDWAWGFPGVAAIIVVMVVMSSSFWTPLLW